MKVDITSPAGTKRSIQSAQSIAARTEFGIQKAWFFIAKNLRAEFNRQVLAKNKTGRLYIRRDKSGRGRKHTASAPGETPANRTGAYRKGIDAVISGTELNFGNTVDYAGFLELGTSRMKKRPGLSNSIKAQERNILRDLATSIKAVI